MTSSVPRPTDLEKKKHETVTRWPRYTTHIYRVKQQNVSQRRWVESLSALKEISGSQDIISRMPSKAKACYKGTPYRSTHRIEFPCVRPPSIRGRRKITHFAGPLATTEKNNRRRQYPNEGSLCWQIQNLTWAVSPHIYVWMDGCPLYHHELPR